MESTETKPLKRLEGLLNDVAGYLGNVEAYSDNLRNYVKYSQDKLQEIRILSAELHKTLGPEDAVAMMDAVALLVDQYRLDNPELKSVVLASPWGSEGWYMDGEKLVIRVPDHAFYCQQTGDYISWAGGAGIMDDQGDYFIGQTHCREFHDEPDYQCQIPPWIAKPLITQGYSVDVYKPGNNWYEKVKENGISRQIRLVCEESPDA